MRQEKQLILFLILKIISESQVPVGSGYIRNQLLSQGFDISEATVGRILRQLDIVGHTEKIGFKGRVLTNIGWQKLDKLEHENKINHYGNELLNVIKVTGKRELMDILMARKAIESQLAKLAAMYITDSEIEELQKIIQIQRNHVETGESIAEDDLEFHKTIARVAKNRVLAAAMDLIRQQVQLSPIFEYIRKEVKSTVLTDHENIFRAIISRNPEKAENAMIRHIENLEKDVERYWEIVYIDDEIDLS